MRRFVETWGHPTLVCLALIILPMAQAQTTQDSKIRAIRQASNEALKRHDLAAFAATLDTDFIGVRGNGSPLSSRQAYIDAFARDFADPHAVIYERVSDKIEISTAAPLAAEHGHWVGRRAGGSIAYKGTYLAMWRSTPTGWKLRSELFVLLDSDDQAAGASYRPK